VFFVGVFCFFLFDTPPPPPQHQQREEEEEEEAPNFYLCEKRVEKVG
jgi:hypothetical protein